MKLIDYYRLVLKIQHHNFPVAEKKLNEIINYYFKCIYISHIPLKDKIDSF